jgi:hypothetical protein
MAALIRGTFFFKDQQDYGWTETIYSLQPTLDTAMAKAQLLLVKRRDLLGNTSGLVQLRVSFDDHQRDSLVYPVPVFDQTTKIPTDAEGSDIANTCLLVRLATSAVVRRSLSLRGYPDNIVTLSGQYSPTAGFRTAFVAWANELTNGLWGIRTKDPAALTVPLDNVIQNVATGEVTITTHAPFVVVPNQAITLRAIRGPNTMNGTWRVFNVINPTNFTVLTRTLIRPYLGGGIATVAQFNVTPINSGIVIRVSHRIAGRPFDSHRGRRSARPR